MAKYHGIKSLAKKYSEDKGITIKEAEERLRDMIKLLEYGISDLTHDGVQFVDSITLKRVIRKARVGRNPKTRIEVKIPETYGVKTVLGKKFLDKIKK